MTMNCLHLICLLICSLLLVTAIPIREDEDGSGPPPYPAVFVNKRLSNEAILRLIMRNRGGNEMKRAQKKRMDLERRSLDDDFSNCFLSPVQCMLPHSRK